MLKLREAVAAAKASGVALGHFNISNSDQFHAVKAAAKACGLPAIVGVSEGEREALGVHEAAALVQVAREEGVQLYLNADHTHTIEKIKEAIDAGFDSVIIDASHAPFEENVRISKEAVALARASGRDVLVEGELGMIGSGSEILDELPQDFDKDLTDPALAKRYVEESGVDLLAPAIGTMHGVLRSGKEARIDMERVKAISASANVPLVVHGGSGSPDEDFVAAAHAGAAIIHISTDLRV
ncbi:MAG TPA: class II fructose-bisphosphate aldolase, partial [Candidatus Paceibacterota bacterium]|nr:class II fructose-bisphosphate aldolase [Candidatus Paceibacterota bacterium]